MKTKSKLIPAKDRSVPLENGQPWPTRKKGDDQVAKLHEVEMSRYYRRRVRDGDLRDPEAEKAAKEAAELAAKETARLALLKTKESTNK